ncbi:MAG: OmpA family protein [Desulforhopalus sp.]|nr:OmpA family protein [Desulforhopalus sp.]
MSWYAKTLPPDAQLSQLGASPSSASLPEIDDTPVERIRSIISPPPSSADQQTTHGNTVFVVDDLAYAPNMPRATHWSVGWADLMMTMFILFLALYAYQIANKEFLSKSGTEIIGGDTTEALQTLDTGRATLPFSPIRPGLPLIASGKIKQVEKTDKNLDRDTLIGRDASLTTAQKTPQQKGEEIKMLPEPLEKAPLEPRQIALVIEGAQKPQPLAVPPVPLPDEDVLGPNPIIANEPAPSPADKFQDIYRLSKGALEENDLGKFAAIDIVPDKTVRIVLTSDLLFQIGESEVSMSARESLEKVAGIIRATPYMINVVGHTDNIPMRSNRFKSNWELSVARASSVARYLIEEVGMDPNQFVVSGYSSYRPVEPNTTAENRAKNRRVEIIISKRLPEPLPATAENLR